MTTMTREQMQLEIDRLKAEAAGLKAAMGKAISMRVSEKGAISIYGFGRFPLTIYAKNMQKLLSMGSEIEAFIETNKATLSWEKAPLAK